MFSQPTELQDSHHRFQYFDFMKRTSISKMSKVALRPLGEAAELLAKAETLEAHGLSARLRIEADNDQ